MNACNCPIDKCTPNLTVPLTQADILKIRNGGLVDVHFHCGAFHKNRLTLLFTLPEYMPSEHSTIAREFMKLGDVRPCPMTDKEIQNIIDSGGSFATPLGDGTHIIWIMTDETRQKLEREKQSK